MNFMCLFRYNHEDVYVIFTDVDVTWMEQIRMARNINNDEIFLYCFKNALYSDWDRAFILIHTVKVSNQFVEDFGASYNIVQLSEEYLP